MPKAVLDSTVLVSAFLNSNGVSYELLRLASAGEFVICLAEEILNEVGRVLAYPRILKKRRYTAEEASAYVELLGRLGHIVSPLPQLRVVIRDPNDDMIIACAVKGRAGHIVTRDKDLLSIGEYRKIAIVSPEEYVRRLKTEND